MNINLTKNQILILCILILLSLIYFYYKYNKYHEHLIGVNMTPNKFLFYKNLCQMFNLKEIPIEITVSNTNIDLTDVCLRSPNFENYIIIQNNTIGILKIIDGENPQDIEINFNHNLINNAFRFVFTPSGSIEALSQTNEILWQTNTQNDNFNTLSLNDNGQVIFSKQIKDASRQLIYNFDELTNTIKFPYQLKDNILTNKLNTIKSKIISYYDDLVDELRF